MLFHRPCQFLRRWWPFFAILFLCGGVAYGQRTVFLVRHAEKSDASADPNLSVAGEERASLLAHLLADADVRTVFVTEWKRTQETAAPLARARDLKPIVIPAKEVNLLAEKIGTSPGAVLVVGHSNTLPAVIKALGVAETLTISETDYDQLFLVTGDSPVQLTRLRY